MTTRSIIARVGRVLAPAWLCASILTAVARPAFAEGDQTVARSLFDSAMKAMKEGKPSDDVCAQLAESHRLDPAIGTHFYWAECLEKTGKIASAWGHYVDVAEEARAAKLEDHSKFARERADALKMRLSKIIVVISDELKATAGLQVKRDGVVLGPATLGTPLPTDPGKHVFSVSAPGKRTWETTVTVSDQGEGATITVAIPTLQPEPTVGPVGTAGAGAGTSVTGAPGSGSADAGTAWGGRHTAGVVLGGLGLLGAGIGAAFGADASGKHDASKLECPSRVGCSARAIELEDGAKGSAAVSTGALIAGGAALAGGVVLFLSAGLPSGAVKEKGAVKGKKGELAMRMSAGTQGAMVTIEGGF
jgi:hypothetical protein